MQLHLEDVHKTLLIDALCCVIASDGTVSGREVTVVMDTLASIGVRMPLEDVRRLVVARCRQIYADRVGQSVSQVIERLRPYRGSPFGELVLTAQDRALRADGRETAAEHYVAARCGDALRGENVCVDVKCSRASHQIPQTSIPSIRTTPHSENEVPSLPQMARTIPLPLISIGVIATCLVCLLGFLTATWTGVARRRTGVDQLQSDPVLSFKHFIASKQTDPGYAPKEKLRGSDMFDVRKTDSLSEPYAGIHAFDLLEPPKERMGLNEPFIYQDTLRFEFIYRGDGKTWREDEAYVTIVKKDLIKDNEGFGEDARSKLLGKRIRIR